MIKFDCLLRDSVGLTALFFALVLLAVFTQFTKDTKSKSLPFWLRAILKAAPALLLTVLAWLLGQPLIALLFLLCSIGDIFLDLPEDRFPRGFVIGGISFALALIVVSIASCQRHVDEYPLLPLWFTNFIIAIFVLRWVFPKLHGLKKILEIFYFSLLILSNAIAATATVPIFLGSSLWFMSDLSIGLGTEVEGDPANSLDTLGLYDLGLYFLAIGFLNT